MQFFSGEKQDSLTQNFTVCLGLADKNITSVKIKSLEVNFETPHVRMVSNIRQNANRVRTTIIREFDEPPSRKNSDGSEFFSVREAGDDLHTLSQFSSRNSARSSFELKSISNEEKMIVHHKQLFQIRDLQPN